MVLTATGNIMRRGLLRFCHNKYFLYVITQKLLKLGTKRKYHNYWLKIISYMHIKIIVLEWNWEQIWNTWNALTLPVLTCVQVTWDYINNKAKIKGFWEHIMIKDLTITPHTNFYGLSSKNIKVIHKG